MFKISRSLWNSFESQRNFSYFEYILIPSSKKIYIKQTKYESHVKR